MQRLAHRYAPLLLLSVLFAWFPAEARAVSLAHRSPDRIAGQAPEAGARFQARYLEPDLIEVDLRLRGKQIQVRKGMRARARELHILGRDLRTGQVTALEPGDARALRRLYRAVAELELGREPLADVFVSALNLLDAWPASAPLRVEMDARSVLTMMGPDAGRRLTRAEFERRRPGGPRALAKTDWEGVSICADINKKRQATYPVREGFLKWSEATVEKMVGPYPESSMGRCGAGDKGDWVPPNNNANRFTQDCLDHDACVDDTEPLGIIAIACDRIFVYCFDDFFYAPDCTPSLKVEIKPESSGAKWRIDPDPFGDPSGDGWHAATEKEEEWLPQGAYTVTFSDVPGWERTTPAIQYVQIIPGQTQTVYAEYLELPPPTQPAATSCLEILERGESKGNGLYTLKLAGRAVTVYCDMTTDGGGWTQVMTSSDDGLNSWTWEKRSQFDAETPIAEFGEAGQPGDYRSIAYDEVGFTDLLFIHVSPSLNPREPSKVWASYRGVGDGVLDLGAFTSSQPSPACYPNPDAGGFKMSAGNLAVDGLLCSTNLYFNVGDHDDGYTSCLDVESEFNQATYGPVWSVNYNDGCPLDDPGTISSLGPDIKYPTTESSAYGFGWALDLNVGFAGEATNAMQVFVR